MTAAETTPTPAAAAASAASVAAAELLASGRLFVTLARAMARVQRTRTRPKAKGPEHRV